MVLVLKASLTVTFESPKHDACPHPILLQMLARVNLSTLLRSNASAIISTGKDFVCDYNGKKCFGMYQLLTWH